MIELEIALQPKQQSFRKSIEDFEVTLYGGAKGGGKSHGLRNILLLRRIQYPGSTGKIFRRSYPELEDNHISPLFRQFPALREYWKSEPKKLVLPNGSELQFCYCKSEADVDLYQGREMHDQGVDEAGQWTENMLVRLRGSNRSSDPSIPARTIYTANPGGLGHAYLKRLFIEKRYKPENDERPGMFNFIPALVDDNAALMEADPGYVRRLNAEPNPALRRAYRFGDWDIFAGQFFGEIDRNVHLIKPFPIPSHWTREGAYDYGFNHPAVFGWFAVDGDGNVYLYRTLARAGLRVDQFCQKLLQFEDTKRLVKIPAGLDCWTQKNVLRDEKKPPTVAEEFYTHGLTLSRANVDRIQGANQVRKYLSWRERGPLDAEGKPTPGKPRLFIFEGCSVDTKSEIVFDCLARMQVDPDRQEDVLKIDATNGDIETGDDPYDMTRYYLMSRPILADEEPPPNRNDPRWNQYQQDQMQEQIYREMMAEKEAQGGNELQDAYEDVTKYY